MPSTPRGSISMTYDDGIAEHLDCVMPDLEQNGLRGTFYVPTGGKAEDCWHLRSAEWAAAKHRGHEIGNHTRFHPCRNPSWEAPNLLDYTLKQITDELREAQIELEQVTGNAPRSFAYPCCHTTIGPDSAQVSYVPFVNEMFPAARVAGSTLADPATVNLPLVPSFVIREGFSIADAISLLDQAAERGQWLVFTFHGIGGGHGLNCPRDIHQELCTAIAARSAKLQCGTFLEIANRIRVETNRPWNKEQ